MKNLSKVIPSLLTILLCNFASYGQGLELVMAPGAKLQTIIENAGLQFCEGPVWDPKNEQLLFSDVMTGTIHTWSEAKGLGIFKKGMAIPTGSKIDANGNLIHCSGGMRGIVKLDWKTGEPQVLVGQIQGKKLNSPNDLVIKRDGSIWFTDPDHGLSFTGQAAEVKEKGVYCFNPNTQEVRLVNASLNQPNGIAFSPDEKYLYVGVAPTPQEYEADPDGVERSVWKFEVTPENTLSHAQRIIVLGPSSWGVDGLSVDVLGNLYVSTGSGIRIFNKNAKYLGTIDTNGEDVVNMAFGGQDRKTLFILGHQSVYAIDLRVAGLTN